jgi:hypothetical protein
MTSEPIDKKLYSRVKSLANKKFKSPSSIYRSSWIVKEYKRLGGKYKGKSSQKSGLKRWYKEKWVDLNRPITNSKGKIIGYKSCGRSSKNIKKYPLCRQSKKITSKTPRTYKELSKKSIKKAKKDKSKIKHSGNIQFGGKPQYYGKRSKIMVKVPENVKKVAMYAFKLKNLGFKGALETGWKRAKQLSTKTEIPIEDLRYMRNWYARHVYTSYPGYKKWIDVGRPKDSSWHNKHAIISWVTWGGNPGFRWVNSQKNINLLNKHFNKDYRKIKIKK